MRCAPNEWAALRTGRSGESRRAAAGRRPVCVLTPSARSSCADPGDTASVPALIAQRIAGLQGGLAESEARAARRHPIGEARA